MAETGKRETPEESGRRQRAIASPSTSSEVQPTAARQELAADVARALATLDLDAAVDSLDAGDRLTPVSPAMPSLVNATAAGPGSSAMPITIPPAAVEVTTQPRDDASASIPNGPEPARPAHVRKADPRALKTSLARKLTTLADEVNECFADFRVGGGDWRVELTAPEGMSTGGGKNALQHLRLVPGRAGHPTIVIGVVDPIEQTAELRDYAHVERGHTARFESAFGVNAEEWEGVLSRCEVVLKLANIRTARTQSDDVPAARPEPRRDLRLRPIAVGFVLVAICAFVIWRIAVSLFG